MSALVDCLANHPGSSQSKVTQNSCTIVQAKLACLRHALLKQVWINSCGCQISHQLRITQFKVFTKRYTYCLAIYPTECKVFEYPKVRAASIVLLPSQVSVTNLWALAVKNLVTFTRCWTVWMSALVASLSKYSRIITEGGVCKIVAPLFKQDLLAFRHVLLKQTLVGGYGCQVPHQHRITQLKVFASMYIAEPLILQNAKLWASEVRTAEENAGFVNIRTPARNRAMGAGMPLSIKHIRRCSHIVA